MNPNLRIPIVIVMLLVTPFASAGLSVDRVNYPAWFERANRIQPLTPGTRLEAGDLVRTGASGRAWLEVDDGSVVKLGQDARFVVARAGFSEEGGDTFLDAAFDVLRGAFRFTSGFFEPRREAMHRVAMRVGAVTVGIRGTDIWGRSSDVEDFVALLEGRIEVSSDDAPPTLMDAPLTLYLKRRGQQAGGVQPVDPDTVAALAPETELDAGAGIAAADGAYALVLMSLQSSEFAAAAMARFREAGYPVVSVPVEVAGASYTRLQLPGLVDRTAAVNLRARLANEFAIGDIWIRETR